MAHPLLDDFRRLKERLGDPLLTVLTILFALMLFVIAPLHAAGIVPSADLGLAVGMVVIGTVLFAYGFSTCRFRFAGGAGTCCRRVCVRHQHRSPIDLYLDASAWILFGLALSWVVGKAVFAPGRITYHRVMGAILLYLTIGLTFVALYTFLGLLIPDAFSGMSLKDTPALQAPWSFSASAPSPRPGRATLRHCTQSREALPTSKR